MATMNKTFAEKALTYVGQDATKFRTWYYGYDAKGVAWCAIFASYVAEQCGLLGKVIKKCEGVGDFPRLGVPADWGTWHEGTTKPKVGDLILFTWNGQGIYEGHDKYFSDHVGIVYKVDSKYVYTVEGNTNGSNDTSVVSKRKYALYSGLINGYYRPDWDKVEEPVNFEAALLQALLRQACACGICKTTVDITNKKGTKTKSAVVECKTTLGYKKPDNTVDVDFITKLEKKIDTVRAKKVKELQSVLKDAQAKLAGDFNGDGKVDIRDATAIQKHLAGID